MADIAARDELTPGRSSAPAEVGAQRYGPRAEPGNQPPRTDVGTLVLHWVTAIAFIVSLFTGIRIAADALNAPVSRWLNPILPQGEIWTWHFLAGLSLFFCAAAYADLHVARGAREPQRAEEDARDGDAGRRARCASAASTWLLHWAAYLIIGIMTVTGIFLYLG